MADEIHPGHPAEPKREGLLHRGTVTFLVVTFGFAWTVLLALFIATKLGRTNPMLRMGLLGLCMFGPALGAIVAQWQRGEAVLAPLGVVMKPNRWWVVAWLAVPVFAVLVGVVSLAFPGVTPALDFSGFIERLAPSLTPDQLAKVTEKLHALPAPLFIGIKVVLALIAGISINAIFALGEELGWRGFLFARPLADGFWKNAMAVGAIWGVWHAPGILQGHNYPNHPAVGVVFMIAWCVLLGAPFQYIRERGGSVIAAAVLHGTINASADLPLLFVRGGSDLDVGITGLAGGIVLIVINAAIWLARRPKHRLNFL